MSIDNIKDRIVKDFENNIDPINEFNINRLVSPERDPYQKGISYIFITTPNLNVGKDGTENIKRHKFFDELHNGGNIKDRDILLSLTHDKSSNLSPYIRLATNLANSFSTSDISHRTKQWGETFNAYKMIIPSESNDSRTAGSFSVTYDELDDIPVTKLHKAWSDYIDLVRRGGIEPSRDARELGYIDYLSSLYYFTLGPDGYTIKYFAKYTGIAPTGVPYSAFSYNKGDNGKVTVDIPYSYVYKEDLNPEILTDFNSISLSKVNPKGSKLSKLSKLTKLFDDLFSNSSPDDGKLRNDREIRDELIKTLENGKYGFNSKSSNEHKIPIVLSYKNKKILIFVRQ